MQLIIDVGNTLTKFFLIENNVLKNEASISTDFLNQLKLFLGNIAPQYVFISSTGNIDEELNNFLKKIIEQSNLLIKRYCQSTIIIEHQIH